MNDKRQPLTNQDGFLIPTVLILMATLAIVGVLVTKDAWIESFVGRNYAIHKQTESAAEQAAKETIANIDEVFDDPVNLSASEVLVDLGELKWANHDDYNTAFDFELADWDDYVTNGEVRHSTTAESLDFVASAESIAVLVDQSTSVLNPGLTGDNVQSYYVYDIYGRAVHNAHGNSEVAVRIGFVEVK